MKNLLYKEFKLAVSPPFVYIVPLLGALLLIPQYPYFIALMYAFFISIPNIFIIGRDQRDIQFSVLLPVRKRDVVKARFYAIIIIELIHIAVAVVFGIIRNGMFPQESSFLMDVNVAFFGFAFIMFGIYNIIFFPMFYKTAYKVGVPVIIAMVAAFVFVVLVEFSVQAVPALRVLDGIQAGTLGAQLPVLAAGILLFAALNVIAFRMSAERFETIDV